MKYDFIHLPMKMEPIVSSETSAIRTQTPGNYPKRNNLQMAYYFFFFHKIWLMLWNEEVAKLGTCKTCGSAVKYIRTFIPNNREVNPFERIARECE